MVNEFFKLADADKSNSISRVEWDKHKQDWQWLFRHIDKDHNLHIDKNEYLAFQEYKRKNKDWQKRLKK